MHARSLAAVFAGLLAAGTIALVGCAKDATREADKATETDAGATNGAADEATETVEVMEEETAPADDAPPAPSGDADAAAADEAAAEAASTDDGVVLLGSADLTSGIPGEGTLSIEEIAAWFDDPKNHAPLEVALPLGLDAGAGQINGLDKNPLTRAKVELGRQLYFEPRLSSDGTISCASCHAADQGWAAHTQFGIGVAGQQGGRNSPVSYNRILSDAQFWDGRAGSLEEQAVGPIANPIEMSNTHEAVVEFLKSNEGYRTEFEKVFEDGVTIDNVGKAIASFERTVVTNPSPFDYYERFKAFESVDPDELKEDDPELYAAYEEAKKGAEEHPMSESAIRGRELFFSDKGGCTACHVGPNLSDEKYHNLGIGMDKEEPDVGRHALTSDEKDKGAFKTPTIRNVELTAPYMHDGSLATLEEVVEWYDKGGHPNPHLSDKIKKLNLTDQEKADLVAFMKACTGEFTPVETGRLPQ